MTFPAPQAASFVTPLDSPWDGDLRAEMAKWGYMEHSRHQLCDFDLFWHMGGIFTFYGMDARPVFRGGPNKCFDVHHGNPFLKDDQGRQVPVIDQTYTVDKKVYRATNAYSTIGINAAAGHIFFISRKSAAYAAKETWKTEPSSADLPALRLQSDLVWGFWNRENNAESIKHINAFWTLEITNKETNAIINQCHNSYSQNTDPPPGRTLVWPGVSFPIETIEGQALLGSPNDIAAGYFLAQHKRQLGGNKIIYTITVFRVKADDFLPNIIFWVKDGPGQNWGPSAPPNPFAPDRPGGGGGVEGGGRNETGEERREVDWRGIVEERVGDGGVVREYVFRVGM
ncbi:hypothetical protein FB567DRAFT_501906 [Paraphoma chrysanthemicola]|uniref:Uncharacterized protein n=1 Tax=Paraphoma chrysanthemicola TaxID=798071 RepID=A0A8K0VVC9_9PLEO|nr:hypothetical protein FB567DRAFT_501906 [Paraphoma chrysanthemicola]